MGNLGFGELLMIFAVALVIFGPRKLPEIGRTIGKALGEFRRATNELKNTLEEEVRVEEVRNTLASARESVTSAVAAVPRTAAVHREVPKHALDTPPEAPPAGDDPAAPARAVSPSE